MANDLFVIRPYWDDVLQTWIFDDEQRNLLREPFVSGADTILTDLATDIPEAKKGFRLTFSAAPFPGFQRRFTWLREESGGNWYRSDDPPMEGWLCPALEKYLSPAPPELYCRAEPLFVPGQKLTIRFVREIILRCVQILRGEYEQEPCLLDMNCEMTFKPDQVYEDAEIDHGTVKSARLWLKDDLVALEVPWECFEVLSSP